MKKLLIACRLITRNQLSKYPPVVVNFERQFANYIGVDHAATMSNATSGLEAALFALGVGPGDEVIAPSYTIHSTFSPALVLGARVKYADINEETLCMEPGAIEALVTPQTKVIIVVHIWGNPADMGSIHGLAERYNLKIIEDCSHCHGAMWQGRKLGSIGDIGVFSLQQSKPISGGEGAIVVSNSEILLDRMLCYGHQGHRISGTLKESLNQVDLFPVTGLGRKYRAHPLAIGLAQVDLDYIDQYNKLYGQSWNFIRNVLVKSSVLRLQRPYSDATMGGYCFGAALWVASDKINLEDVLAIFKAEGLIAHLGYTQFNHVLPHLYDREFRDAMYFNTHSERTLPAAPELPVTERIINNGFHLDLVQFRKSSTRRRFLESVNRLEEYVKNEN